MAENKNMRVTSDFVEENKNWVIEMAGIHYPDVIRENKVPKIMHIDYRENDYVCYYFEMINKEVWVFYNLRIEEFTDEDTNEIHKIKRYSIDTQIKSLITFIINTDDKISQETLESYLGDNCISVHSNKNLFKYKFLFASKFWHFHRQLEISLDMMEKLPQEILKELTITAEIQTYSSQSIGIQKEYISRLLSLNAQLYIVIGEKNCDFESKKINKEIHSHIPIYIYDANLKDYVNDVRIFRRNDELKQDKLKLYGFDPEGEPEIRIDDEDGYMWVVFNFMPPSKFEMLYEEFQEKFGDFAYKMENYIGVDVIWEDREFFLIKHYKEDTISKLIDFVENFWSREGNL